MKWQVCLAGIPLLALACVPVSPEDSCATISSFEELAKCGEPAPTTKAGVTPVVPAPTPTPVATLPPNVGPWSAIEVRVLELHNSARAEAGLAPLAAHDALAVHADRRCLQIQSNFSHDGWLIGFPFSGLKTWGENIAFGQANPQAVHTAWMGSSGHRANVLRDSFEFAGVGHCQKNGVNYWAVNFGG